MTPTRHLALGTVLTASAGLIDAVGFIELGGYFTSFMSGNTTQGGAALVDGAWPVVLLTASLIVLFFIGSVLGALAAFSSTRWGPAAVSAAVSAGVALTLALTMNGFPPNKTMLVLAASAGAQNAILPMRGAVRLGATFVTGTLYTAGQDLALALRGAAPPQRWLQHLAVWSGLYAGAAIGALLYRFVGIYTLCLPAAVYVAFTFGHLWAGRRSAI
ncbi:YoaK family protein [Devosia sp. XJ19-1]|uniref:YoaK family protein n=1 Tax=Devosia ureilytica TaxID=2952754 RepID=A0A9Q4ALQ8_9HYPH|nr:YoaK family protein [Devosia ureilytica]MCP8882180.1 YoaK family protein [Devosia ureilytica]MCP8885933.1 YoaK family protein [Devosia ureilytica]